MKRFLMLGLALAAGLLALPARAEVDVYIGAGVPAVVTSTHRHHHHYAPPSVRHHHYVPPSVRHRHYGPPLLYYPERVYRHPGGYHGHRHYKYKNVRPPVHDRHLRQGQRPPPPHARAWGPWGR